VQVFTSSRRPDRLLGDCGESHGSERGIVIEVEVDVTYERSGPEGCPAEGGVRIRVLHFDRKIPVVTRRRS
jgi:hypothetical protein